jgi:hypothetical protein
LVEDLQRLHIRQPPTVLLASQAIRIVPWPTTEAGERRLEAKSMVVDVDSFEKRRLGQGLPVA